MQHFLKLLADSTRLRILAAVEDEELAVNEIADVLDMNQPRISNHLRLLRDGNALRGRREGAWTFYRNALGEKGHAERAALWDVVKRGLQQEPLFRADRARQQAVMERRRRRSREHFAADDGATVALERGSLREEMLAALVPADAVVVDAGCGDGYLTELLAERFRKVLAFDHSPERLAAARRRLGPGVLLEPAEVDALPLRDASTDAIFLSMVLHHVPEIARALAEARRVLRPDGRIVIADLAPHEEESMRETMGDLRLGLDPRDLTRKLRQAGFRNIRTLPVRDRLLPGRRRALDLILITGQSPASPRPRKKPKKKP